jgi:hypothetical protein
LNLNYSINREQKKLTDYYNWRETLGKLPKMWTREQIDNDGSWTKWVRSFNEDHGRDAANEWIDSLPMNVSKEQEYDYYVSWYSKKFTKLGRALT